MGSSGCLAAERAREQSVRVDASTFLADSLAGLQRGRRACFGPGPRLGFGHYDSYKAGDYSGDEQRAAADENW